MEDFVFYVYCCPEFVYNGYVLAFFERSDLKKKNFISYLHYNSTMLTPQIQNEAVVYNIQL